MNCFGSYTQEGGFAKYAECETFSEAASKMPNVRYSPPAPETVL